MFRFIICFDLCLKKENHYLSIHILCWRRAKRLSLNSMFKGIKPGENDFLSWINFHKIDHGGVPSSFIDRG